MAPYCIEGSYLKILKFSGRERIRSVIVYFSRSRKSDGGPDTHKVRVKTVSPDSLLKQTTATVDRKGSPFLTVSALPTLDSRWCHRRVVLFTSSLPLDWV